MDHRALLLFASLLLLPGARAQTFVIDTVAGWPGILDGGPATQAALAQPLAVATDAQGNVYIADTLYNRVRKINVQGVITTFAGDGQQAFGGDGGQATAAQLFTPTGVAVDAAGNVYIADSGNHRIRRVNTSGIISTFAGTGVAVSSGDNGQAAQAGIAGPQGLAFDSQGNLLIAGLSENRIRRINTSGVITTVAGTGAFSFGGDNGLATLAFLASPASVAVAPVGSPNAGTIYIADFNNSRIRAVSPQGIITTVAGDGTFAFGGDGGPSTAAKLGGPYGVAADATGRIYLADGFNQRIRVISTGGTISTIAGNGTQGFSGDGGDPLNATMDFPGCVSVTASNAVYFCDVLNSLLRRVANNVITTVAGHRRSTGSGPAIDAELFFPVDVATLADGSIVIADANNHVIRKVTFASPGTVSTVAGTGLRGFSGDTGAATAAQLNFPNGVAADTLGNIYIADSTNQRVRKVSTNGTITTVAGSGVAGYSGDNGLAVEARLNFPAGVAVDPAGAIYILEGLNNTIRMVSPSGIIRTIAGTGQAGFSGDNGPATEARLAFPARLAVTGFGLSPAPAGLGLERAFLSGSPNSVENLDSSVLVADAGNHRIRRISPAGMIETIAGNGQPAFVGDGQPAKNAGLNFPRDIAVDADGNLFITDTQNHRIRAVPRAIPNRSLPPALDGTPGVIRTIAGSGTRGFSGDKGSATSAALDVPTGIAVDAQGRVYIADQFNHRVRLIDEKLPAFTADGVGNAAKPGAGPVAPDSIANLFGLNLAASNAANTGGQLPTTLAGMTLEIKDRLGVTRPSPLFGIFGNGAQVNFFVPADTATGAATLTVRRDDGRDSSAAIQIESVAPGIFSVVNGASQTIALAQYIRIANGVGGPLELTFNPANLQLVPINLGPASDQVFLVLFGTGFRLSTGPLAATVGGEAVGVAIAAAAGFSGLDQANLGPLPRTLIGRGAVSVSFSASGKQANPVMVNIQ